MQSGRACLTHLPLQQPGEAVLYEADLQAMTQPIRPVNVGTGGRRSDMSRFRTFTSWHSKACLNVPLPVRLAIIVKPVFVNPKQGHLFAEKRAILINSLEL